jgi:hypothetical protein
LSDTDGDLICDENEVVGCQDDTACNYNPLATDAGTCEFASAGLDCDGNCLNDSDGDLVCDENEVGGCQDSGACNYNAGATDDDGSCEFTSCAGCSLQLQQQFYHRRWQLYLYGWHL